MIILHFHLQPQFIYEIFHINFISLLLLLLLLLSKSRDTAGCDGKIKKLKATKSLPNIINETYIVEKSEINCDICSVKLFGICPNVRKHKRQENNDLEAFQLSDQRWEGLIA